LLKILLNGERAFQSGQRKRFPFVHVFIFGARTVASIGKLRLFSLHPLVSKKDEGNSSGRGNSSFRFLGPSARTSGQRCIAFCSYKHEIPSSSLGGTIALILDSW